MKKTLIAVAGLLIAAAFTLDCCMPCAPTERAREKAAERFAERLIERSSGEKVDIDMGGESASNIPSELVYPGAKKSEGSISISGTDEGSVSWVYFESSASYAGIKGYYGALGSKGWTRSTTWEATDDEGRQYCQYHYSKGEKKVIITVTDEDDTRKIAIWYGMED